MKPGFRLLCTNLTIPPSSENPHECCLLFRGKMCRPFLLAFIQIHNDLTLQELDLPYCVYIEQQQLFYFSKNKPLILDWLRNNFPEIKPEEYYVKISLDRWKTLVKDFLITLMRDDDSIDTIFA